MRCGFRSQQQIITDCGPVSPAHARAEARLIQQDLRRFITYRKPRCKAGLGALSLRVPCQGREGPSPTATGHAWVLLMRQQSGSSQGTTPSTQAPTPEELGDVPGCRQGREWMGEYPSGPGPAPGCNLGYWVTSLPCHCLGRSYVRAGSSEIGPRPLATLGSLL